MAPGSSISTPTRTSRCWPTAGLSKDARASPPSLRKLRLRSFRYQRAPALQDPQLDLRRRMDLDKPRGLSGPGGRTGIGINLAPLVGHGAVSRGSIPELRGGLRILTSSTVGQLLRRLSSRAPSASQPDSPCLPALTATRPRSSRSPECWPAIRDGSTPVTFAPGRAIMCAASRRQSTSAERPGSRSRFRTCRSTTRSTGAKRPA